MADAASEMLGVLDEDAAIANDRIALFASEVRSHCVVGKAFDQYRQFTTAHASLCATFITHTALPVRQLLACKHHIAMPFRRIGNHSKHFSAALPIRL